MDDAENTNQPKSIKYNEDIFLQILKKEKLISKPTKQSYQKNRIYNGMRILSSTKLDITARNYYKFPFTHIKNYTTDMHREWLVALKNVFYNFTKKQKTFYLLFIDSVLIFKNGRIKTDTKIKETLIKEDIHFRCKGSYLYIEDVRLFFDFVINYEYMKTLPFILSRHRFVNSIYYKNVVKECGVVKRQGEMQYRYGLTGYFFVNDYKRLFGNDLMFNM